MSYNIIIINKSLFLFLFFAVFWTSLLIQFAHAESSLQQQQQHYISQNNVMDLLRQLPETSKLVSLLDPNIHTYLTEQKNISFFAPNNDAFSSEATQQFDTNSSWYHILPTYCPDWNKNSSLFELTKWNNSLVKLTYSSKNLEQKIVESGMMQYANVQKSIPINQQNSVVHIIDKILTVPVDINTTLSKLGYTKARDLFREIQSITSDQITLFVPNDDAFGTVDPSTVDNLLAQAHVSKGLITSNIWANNNNNNTVIESVNGLNMTISKHMKMQTNNSYYWQVSESEQFPAKIVTSDVLLENGVMHIIDQVLWANNWDRITKSRSNASQTKLNQPIICSFTLIIILMIK